MMRRADSGLISIRLSPSIGLRSAPPVPLRGNGAGCPLSSILPIWFLFRLVQAALRRRRLRRGTHPSQAQADRPPPRAAHSPCRRRRRRRRHICPTVCRRRRRRRRRRRGMAGLGVVGPSRGEVAAAAGGGHRRGAGHVRPGRRPRRPPCHRLRLLRQVTAPGPARFVWLSGSWGITGDRRQ
jgi:hypothetical protein